jgi:hypothetical protein
VTGRTRTTTALLRADAAITEIDARRLIGSLMGFPLEIDDDGSEYFRASSGTTLDVTVDDAVEEFPVRLLVWHWSDRGKAIEAADKLRRRIADATGWVIVHADEVAQPSLEEQ